MHNPKALSDTENKIIPTVECLIVHNNKVLLMKRSEDAKKFPGFWVGPGGHVDEDEDYLSAAIREVKEETGVEVGQEDIKLRVVAIGNHLDRKETYLVLYFLVKLKDYKDGVDSTEGKVSWIDISEIPKLDNLFPPFKYYIEHVLSSTPGVLYTNVQLESSQIVNVLSRRIDKDY